MILLNASVAKQIGITEEYGIDKVLSVKAITCKKDLLYLETVAEQFEFFDNLPTKAQEVLLVSTLKSWQDISTKFLAISDAWKTGDIEALEALLLELALKHPQVERV